MVSHDPSSRRPQHPTRIAPPGGRITSQSSQPSAAAVEDGVNLEHLSLITGPLAPEAVCRIGSELAAALAVLHKAGRFHGALGASTVLIGKSGSVRLASGYVEPQQRLQSPERRMSQGGSCAADDLYALGVILVEAALGETIADGRSHLDARALGAAIPDRLVDALDVLLAPGEARLTNAAAAVRIFKNLEASYGDGPRTLRAVAEKYLGTRLVNAFGGLGTTLGNNQASAEDGDDVEGPITLPDPLAPPRVATPAPKLPSSLTGSPDPVSLAPRRRTPPAPMPAPVRAAPAPSVPVSVVAGSPVANDAIEQEPTHVERERAFAQAETDQADPYAQPAPYAQDAAHEDPAFDPQTLPLDSHAEAQEQPQQGPFEVEVAPGAGDWSFGTGPNKNAGTVRYNPPPAHHDWSFGAHPAVASGKAQIRDNFGGHTGEHEAAFFHDEELAALPASKSKLFIAVGGAAVALVAAIVVVTWVIPEIRGASLPDMKIPGVATDSDDATAKLFAAAAAEAAKAPADADAPPSAADEAAVNALVAALNAAVEKPADKPVDVAPVAAADVIDTNDMPAGEAPPALPVVTRASTRPAKAAAAPLPRKQPAPAPVAAKPAPAAKPIASASKAPAAEPATDLGPPVKLIVEGSPAARLKAQEALRACHAQDTLGVLHMTMRKVTRVEADPPNACVASVLKKYLGGFKADEPFEIEAP